MSLIWSNEGFEFIDEGLPFEPQAGEEGSYTWGHDTGVEEDNIKNLSEGSGTGAVLDAGDSENLELDEGENWELPTVNVGSGTKVIELNKYGSGDGSPIVKYKTGDSEINCDADTWHDYSGNFTSTGWSKIQLSRAA